MDESMRIDEKKKRRERSGSHEHRRHGIISLVLPFQIVNSTCLCSTSSSDNIYSLICLNMTEPGPRKRSRAACSSCQSRKRKCSGDQPCTTCLQFGSECYYDLGSRKKKDTKRLQNPSSLQQTPSLNANPPTTNHDILPKSRSPVDSNMRLSSLEANSGAAFVRRLGLKIDPANAPRLNLFAWNIGARRSPTSLPPSSYTTPMPVVDIISQNEMNSLTARFFEKIDPCYGFVDRDTILRQISRRWLPPAADDALPYGLYDAVLCGVAAFASLFSRREASATELQLVESARLILEENLFSESPTVDTVTAWVLRVCYLRTTGSPHAAWLTSCTLMHLIEAAGLHLELNSDTVLLRSQESCHPETRRRLFAMARHLNVWLSFELGRSRVVLHGATSLPPTPRSNNYTEEIFSLLPLSESLDPTKLQDSHDLETALSDVVAVVHVQQPLILAQCNLMLCIYRRLRALNTTISPSLLDSLLALAGKGLRAAREMVAVNCPWHQAANVPFQVICTLLAIDNRSSLSLLPEAMQTLREVATAYDTDVLREAYSTAYLLIMLHQRRKEEETRALGDVLRANPAASATRLPEPKADGNEPGSLPSQDCGINGQEHVSLPFDSEDLSWIGDLVIDMPSLQNFDLERFLTTDVPWPLPETGI